MRSLKLKLVLKQLDSASLIEHCLQFQAACKAEDYVWVLLFSNSAQCIFQSVKCEMTFGQQTLLIATGFSPRQFTCYFTLRDNIVMSTSGQQHDSNYWGLF